jgi:hypothetical protein
VHLFYQLSNSNPAHLFVPASKKHQVPNPNDQVMTKLLKSQ